MTSPLGRIAKKLRLRPILKKMVAGKAEIIKLFHSELIKKWILLVPLHDSKDVTLHCTKKTKDLRMQNTGFLDPAFEVCIHDQGLFPEANLKTAMSEFTNISLNVQPPTQLELDQWRAGSPDLVTNATAKLSKRAFPGPIQDAVTNGIELFLKSGALIEALRTSAPDLYEKIVAAISQRARRLSYVGPQGGPVPSNIMNTELETLIRSIQDAAPALSQNNAEEIALGALSDWIMRCPLDFPPYDV